MLLYWVRSDITKVIRVIAVPTGDDYQGLGSSEVERRVEGAGAGGSIPSPGTKKPTGREHIYITVGRRRWCTRCNTFQRFRGGRWQDNPRSELGPWPAYGPTQPECPGATED